MKAYRTPFLMVFLVMIIAGILVPTTGTCGSPAPNQKSLLWKVSGKGIKTSYLYGTFHLVPKDQFVLPSKVKQKMIKSETVVLEVDLESPALTSGMFRAMKMAKPIESLMSVTDFNFLTQFVHDSLERNMQSFRYIKPAFLGQMLLYPKLLGYNPESYDLALLELAKQWHKSIYTLETPQEQLALFEQSSLEIQISQFLNNVRQFDRQRKLMQRMLSLYQQEDLTELYAVINAEQVSEGSQDLLLTKRNQKWLSPLVAKMKQSSSFVAVGAAHLPGENGLIELLRQQGYTVEPVF